MCNSIKGYISLTVLFVEGFVQGAQRKELTIAPFVKRFKVATLILFKTTSP